MTTKITRKDFLNGLALTAGGALLKPLHLLAQSTAGDAAQEFFLANGITQDDPRYYPPALTGMRGSHPGSFDAAHAMRDGKRWDPASAADTGESYDLVIVGGGLSGLAAAHFFRQQRGPKARILILDNHDDFGGHAKRNEFRSGSLIGYGGTQEVEGWPEGWSPEAKGLLRDLDIHLERFARKYYDRDFRKQHGLKYSMFFDKETFGADATVTDIGLPTWGAFVARTPLTEKARRDLVRFQTAKIDYMPGISVEEKMARLGKMSFQTFLQDYAKVDPQVVAYFKTFVAGGFGAQIDVMPALFALTMSGFGKKYWEGLHGVSTAAAEGMGMPAGSPFDAEEESPWIYHFPDGNASIARMLVRSLIPGSAPGSTMEDIVTAKMDYTKLDRDSSSVRLRLNSTGVRVRHVGDPATAKEVEIFYARGGKTLRVRGAACVLACYNMMIPYLCPELPQKQKEALAFGSKVPLVYANAQLRQWTALKKLGLSMVYCPGSYFSEVYMDFPVSMGGYRFAQTPDEPVVLHMVRVPCQPGLPARVQRRVGRTELYTTSFETFEHHIRDQLQRMLGPGGFDAERDIQAITVNRWPHGYADHLSDMDDPNWAENEQPNVVGRKPFGRIAIANSDAAAMAQTQAAIDQAYRAVQEVSRV